MAQSLDCCGSVNLDAMQETLIDESVDDFLQEIDEGEGDEIRNVLKPILENSFGRFKVSTVIIVMG